MSREKENPGPTSIRVAKLELALFGANGRGGMVNQIQKMSNKITRIDDWRKDQVKKQQEKEHEAKKKHRDWRGLFFSVLGSIIAGVVMYALGNL